MPSFRLISLITSLLLLSDSAAADTTSVSDQTLDIHGGLSIASGAHIGSRFRFLDLFVLEASYGVNWLPRLEPCNQRLSFGLIFFTNYTGSAVLSFQFVTVRGEGSFPTFFEENAVVVSVGWLPLRRTGVSPFFRGGVIRVLGKSPLIIIELNVGVSYVFQ